MGFALRSIDKRSGFVDFIRYSGWMIDKYHRVESRLPLFKRVPIRPGTFRKNPQKKVFVKGKMQIETARANLNAI
jgi:hypothetical protein